MTTFNIKTEKLKYSFYETQFFFFDTNNINKL